MSNSLHDTTSGFFSLNMGTTAVAVLVTRLQWPSLVGVGVDRDKEEFGREGFEREGERV